MADEPIPSLALRAGDPTAFDRLYADFAPRVLGYLLRLTGGCRAEAEDLTQDTFLAAYAGRDGFSGRTPLAWLLGIARRRERDRFRAATVRPQTTLIESEVRPEPDSLPLDEVVARRAALTEALDRLDTAERDAVLLVIVQGLTYTEAAAILEEPVGTVKWRVHEATKRLRKLLRSSFAEEAQSISRKEADRHVATDSTKQAIAG